MEKSIQLSEYHKERNLHPTYTYTELIDSAWIKTDEGIKHINRTARLIQIFQQTGTALISLKLIADFPLPTYMF